LSTAHYEREKAWWDARGSHDYATLSAFDQSRIVDWIGWAGNGRILDVGGGAGMVSRLLADRPGTWVTCLDISAEMLAHAPVPGIQADGLALPVKSDAFDLIVAAAFLHHLPGDEYDILKECHRILAPGGRLVGYDPSGTSLQNRVFMGDGPLRLKRFTPDERPIRPDLVQSQAERAGFGRFRYDSFTFRNETKTGFELVQTYLVNPIARGPLKKYLDRWFFWEAVKATR
jgi:SAM-dependent methyltransferase